MADEKKQASSLKDNPWAVAIVGGTVPAILGGWLGDLGPLYVILLALAAALVVSFGWFVWQAVSRWRQLELAQAAAATDLLWLRDRLQEQALKDVIHEARVHEWTVDSSGPGAGLTFVSPDDDVVQVPGNELSQEETADRLHTMAPHYFRDKWMPSPVRALVEAKIDLKKLREEFTSAREELDGLKDLAERGAERPGALQEVMRERRRRDTFSG